jgi:hypothetical protein
MRRTALPWLAAALVLLVPAVAGADDGTFSSYEQRGYVWMFLAAFGFGFLTSLTPCVYPMIPITLSIFGARGKDVSKRRAVALATMYVVGMGLTYAILGVTFALIGKAGDFGTQLANPWIVFPLVILFLALAASMFGAFDLNLPSSLQAVARASAARSRWVSSAASSQRRARAHSSRASSPRSPRRATSASAPRCCSRTRSAWACCSGCLPRSHSRFRSRAAGWKA